MIATGGTMIHAAKLLKENGAKDIIVAVSLPFFNGNAVEKIERAYQEEIIKMVIGTDAVFWGESFVQNTEWYQDIVVH